MKTIIHVHQNKIRHNIKNPDKKEPPIIVRTTKNVQYGNEVVVDGPCKIVYSPDKPLSCGARVWIETESKVTIKE